MFVSAHKIMVGNFSLCGCSFISTYENADVFLSVNKKILIKNTHKMQTDISTTGVFLTVVLLPVSRTDR